MCIHIFIEFMGRSSGNHCMCKRAALRETETSGVLLSRMARGQFSATDIQSVATANVRDGLTGMAPFARLGAYTQIAEPSRSLIACPFFELFHYESTMH